jgi:hypothetical protein
MEKLKSEINITKNIKIENNNLLKELNKTKELLGNKKGEINHEDIIQ